MWNTLTKTRQVTYTTCAQADMLSRLLTEHYDKETVMDLEAEGRCDIFVKQDQMMKLWNLLKVTFPKNGETSQMSFLVIIFFPNIVK